MSLLDYFEQGAQLRAREAQAMAEGAQALRPTPAQAAYMAASMAPGFGATDAAGQAGRMPRQGETFRQGLLADGTSMAENLEQGNILDFGLQGLGLLGDAAYAIPAVGVGVAGALKAPRAIQQAAKIRAFHGSPYQFDEFSDKAIGSGEGAQAYGYGHYLAEREGTARSYRDALRSKNLDKKRSLKEAGIDESLSDESLRTFSSVIFDAANLSPDLSPTQMADIIQGASIEFRSVPKSKIADAVSRYQNDMKGSMYEVEIDADPSELLDYDKPLSQQSPDLQRKVNQAIKSSRSPLVKKETDELFDGLLAEGFEPPMVDGKPVDRFGNEALAEITGNLRTSRDAEVTRINTEMSKQAKIMGLYEIPGRYGKYTDPKGENAAQKYDALMDERANLPTNFDQRAAQLLKEAGVKGIKYADAQTRFSPGEKTSNYVIFDPRLIEISKRYGVPITVAATMLAQMDEQQPRGLL